MTAAGRSARLAELRAALEVERSTPSRNACHARAIEREIEDLLADERAAEREE